MFLTENFKNFIKSSVSSAALQAYSQSSFNTVTNSLMNVVSQVKSKVAMTNALLTIFDMSLQNEDPKYLDKMNSDMDEAIENAIHETEYGNEIQSALDELSDLAVGCGLSDNQTPQSGQYKSVSTFGPDGKQYDFVIMNPTVTVEGYQCYVASCESPTELADCIVMKKDGKFFVNPIIRGNNFTNGAYCPPSIEAKISYFAQLYNIDIQLDASYRDQLYEIADYFGLAGDITEQDQDIDIANYILSDYFEDTPPDWPYDDLGLALDRMLVDAFTDLDIPVLSGSVTTISTLASCFAEQNSVDELHINVVDALVHNHFSEGVLSGIAIQYGNMRATYSSAVNKLHQAIGRGGITGLVAYLVEYYRQQHNQSGDSATQTWQLSDQSKLIPKNFVCNVGSIVLQVFSVLANVIGTFFGIIGMAIGGVLSTGFNIANKLINFVNDKGRAFYSTDLSFMPAANVSIFQTYIHSGLLSSRLLALLQANPSIYTTVPGAILVLSLDNSRNRVILDAHPLYHDVDLSELIRSSTAYEAISYCDAYFRHMTTSDITEWYAQHCAAINVSFDPSASEVAGEDKEVANSYLSSATDQAMLQNLRNNTTVFFAFIIALVKGSITYAGFEGYQGGHHTGMSPLLTEALFCGCNSLGISQANVINTAWGWGDNWTSFIEKLSLICEWSKSLWDPDLPSMNTYLFTDNSSGTYPSQYGYTTVDLSELLRSLVTASNAYVLSDVVQISNDAQWALIAPKWNSASFWQVFIGTAIASAIIAAVVVISSVAISRKIAASRAKRQASVEQAWSEYAKDPSNPDLYDQYRKSVRSNNMFANIFGGTKYSKNNYWETIGDDDNAPSSDEGQGETIITRLYDSYTGTDVIPDPVNEIKQLIRGTV